MNGSPKTSVNTAVNTVLTHPPGKTRYTCKNPGIPEKYLGPRQCRARPTPRAPAPTAARTACSSTRTAPCTLATSAKGSIGALRQARLAGVAVRTMRSCRHQAPPWPGNSTGESTRWRSGRAPSLRTPLALYALVYASRQGLPEVLAFFWHPHHIAHHPRVHRQFALLAAVCRCILVLEDQLACSTSKRPIVAVHRAAASLSTAQRARGRDNSGLW